MKFPNFKMNKWFTARAFVLLAGLFLMALTVPAQTKTEAGANPGLEQCRNGGPNSPQQCIGNAWVTGSANAVQSHYAETQFLPYRFTLEKAAPNTTYTVTIGYDILKNGKHAIDYLGTYNLTETNADPCSDKITGCNPLVPTDTVNIPKDTVTVPASILQPQGQFYIWGATFNATGPGGAPNPDYVPYANGDHRSITVTFTTTANSTTVVLAWGGHVAWAGDWGAGNSAGGIDGAPYHTNIDGCIGFSGCGALDVQLMASAVAPAGLVRVTKQANTLDGSGIANTAFDFTTSPLFGVTTFTLVDQVAGDFGATKQSSAITVFGAGNSIVITEQNEFGWTSAGVTCTPNFAGTVVSTSSPAQPAAFAAQATVYVNPGGLVECTFVNSQLQITAAPASVAGRVTTSFGSGISGARVSIVDFATGETRLALTNSFGYYSFTGLEVGHFYQLGVSAKKYSFQQSVKSFSLTSDLSDVNFVAN